MYYAPTLIIISLLKMAKSFFLSLLVVFLAALMLFPQHSADAINLGPIIGKIKPPKPTIKCSKIFGKYRGKDCPPATHFWNINATRHINIYQVIVFYCIKGCLGGFMLWLFSLGLIVFMYLSSRMFPLASSLLVLG